MIIMFLVVLDQQLNLGNHAHCRTNQNAQEPVESIPNDLKLFHKPSTIFYIPSQILSLGT